MTIGQLKRVLADLPDDMPIVVAFNGELDADPTYYVDDDILFVEGANEPAPTFKN